MPMDPFAASYRFRPQKRANHDESEEEGPGTSKKARYSGPGEYADDEQVWADEATRAYEEGGRIFTLKDKGLRSISVRFIQDLKNMVVLAGPNGSSERANSEPGSRSGSKSRSRLFEPSAPAVAARQVRRTFSRNESKNSNLFPGEKDENIHLYLSKNMITRLPNELWTLENLTILSLRGNKLTYLPPEIGNLKNLRDLNVSANQLSYLPSELNNLPNLRELAVHPNHLFLSPPDPDTLLSEPEFVMDSRVPSLTEIAFRILGSPPSAQMQEKYDKGSEGAPSAPLRNALEYYLPLEAAFLRCISPPLLQTLNACAPDRIPMPKKEDDEDESVRVASISRCGNPDHIAWFVRHAEQRFTWETKTATGVLLGGIAPMRWRGCLRGCLSFLETRERERKNELKEAELELEPMINMNGPLTFDDD